jgi:hypothetical protein
VRSEKRKLRACPLGPYTAPFWDQAEVLLECLGRQLTRVATRNAAVRLPGGEPCEGEPQARFWEGVLETEPGVHGDGLSPCSGNLRTRRPGLPTLDTAPAPHSTTGNAARKFNQTGLVRMATAQGLPREALRSQPTAEAFRTVDSRVFPAARTAPTAGHRPLSGGSVTMRRRPSVSRVLENCLHGSKGEGGTGSAVRIPCP